jgi:outer membrane murein-binding lipoprotein Lpp
MKKTTTILSVLLVAAVIVAGVFISQKNTVASEKDELSKQVESLNTQLESLTEQDKTSKAEAEDFLPNEKKFYAPKICYAPRVPAMIVALFEYYVQPYGKQSALLIYAPA